MRRLGRILLIATVSITLRATAQAPSVQGSYELIAVGAHRLPVMFSRFIPGEGTTIQAVQLDLLPGGRLRGHIAVSYTDSGTVTDTVLMEGTWRIDRDSVRIAYGWSRPCWRPCPTVFEAERVVRGVGDGQHLRLPELAFFNPDSFEVGTGFEFRRVDAPLQPN